MRTALGRHGHGLGRWTARRLHGGEQRLADELGGSARTRVIFLLACILALDGADKGAIGALAPQLEASLHIGNTQIGLLVTVSSLVGAAAALPMGVLADRTRRTRILVVSILVWGVAEAVSGLSVSFFMLLLTRLALGAITATAGPAVASLTGDLFGTGERSRVYSFILTGELIGTGIGVLIAGEIGAATSWRAGFFVLAVPSFVLAWAIHRFFPEPARGGRSRLEIGATEVVTVEEVAAHPDAHPAVGDETDADGPRIEDVVRQEVVHEQIAPNPKIVIHGDPTTMRIWPAVRWVLSVRTNVLLILASSLGYFFFAGLSTFAVIFVRGRYGISQGEASLLVIVVGAAAVCGLLLSGRWTDRLLHAGRIDARLVVGALGFIVAAIVFVPGILSTSLAISLPFFLIAAAALSVPNPALDAARLDVVPSRMWGRAESIRTVVRTVLEAFAPLLFGIVSDALSGARSSGLGTGVNQNTSHLSTAGARGLEFAFLIMLIPLAASGVMLLLGRRSYPVDVASAAASEEETRAALAGR